jgi:hypothetical protein
VLFVVSKTAHDEESPTENVLGENACPDWCFGKILDPKKGSSFPLNYAIPNYPKKGLLYARYFNRFQTFTGRIFFTVS